MVGHLAHELVVHAQDDGIVILLGAAHARHEDVARHGLHDVLDQLAVVRLLQLPLARELVHALVHELAVLVDVHAAVAQVPARRQAAAHVPDAVGPLHAIEAHHVAAHAEALAICTHGRTRRALDVVPEALRRGVRLTPRVHNSHDGLVVHCVEHRAAHLAIGTEAAAVASSELGHLALRLALGLRHVERIFGEDAPGGDLVQVCALAAIVRLEGLDLPLLARHPRKHAPLNVGQVGDGELLALGGDQTAAHGEGATLADVVVQDVFAVRLKGNNRLLLHVAVEPVGRSGQVLRLKDTPRVTACASCAAELHRPAQATVGRGRVHQCAVLRGRRGRGLLADLKQLTRQRVQFALQQGLDGRLRQVFQLKPA